MVFTKLIGLFTNSIPFYMGIIAAFCLASWGIFFYRYSRNLWISTILFVNLYFLYLNMNFLRQSIAVSIALFAWTFLKNRRFLPFLGLILLASLFHTTALILLPVYALVRLRPGAGQLLLYSYALLFFYISSEGILNLLTMVFHEEYANSIFLQGISIFYVVAPVVLLALLLLYQKRMLAAAQENRYLIGLVFFGVFCLVMMSRHAILERLSYYAFAYVMIAIPALLDALKIPLPGAERRFVGGGRTTGRLGLFAAGLGGTGDGGGGHYPLSCNGTSGKCPRRGTVSQPLFLLGGDRMKQKTLPSGVAKVMFGFCSWVVETAREKGLHRLYFLARDGYLLREISQMICQKRGYDLSCRYLYASRLAWRLPACHLDYQEACRYVFSGALRLTFRGMMSRIRADDSQCRMCARWAGISEEQLDAPLPEEERKRIALLLENERGFRLLLEEKSREAYDPVMIYLEQEGLMNGDPVALVDSGWTGGMQHTLRQLLESAGCHSPLIGFYFGLYTTPGVPADGEYLAWYFSPRSPVRYAALFNNNVLESLCTAPHAMTVGYSVQQGWAVPEGKPPGKNRAFLAAAAITAGKLPSAGR